MLNSNSPPIHGGWKAANPHNGAQRAPLQFPSTSNYQYSIPHTQYTGAPWVLDEELLVP